MTYRIQDEHLVIVRTGGSIINLDSYNCQELGLAKALTKKGLKVTIILAGIKNEIKRIKVNDHEVLIYFLKFKSINQALSWFHGIEEILSQLHPTCIQIHEFGMLMSYRVLKWAMKNKIKIYLIQGSYQTTQKPILKPLEQFFNHTFGKYIIKNVQGIGCKSRMASMYINKYIQRNTFSTFIGLDTEKFQKALHNDWYNQLGIKDKNILLYVGSLEKRRNPDFLLSIIEKLPKNYVLIIVGHGPMEHSLKEEMNIRNIEKKCFFLGKLKQEDLPSLYKIADLFLLASDYEIYGMVILEAMYYGTPVISTLTAGSEILIKDNKTGIILHHKDKLIWSQTIQELCSDKKRLYKMKLQASAKIRNELTWDKASNMFLSLYNIKP